MPRFPASTTELLACFFLVHSVYAKLHVRMLQHQEAGDKLLALLQAMKKR